MKHKTSNLIALIAFILIVVIWAIFMFWLIYPYKTVTINEQPYIVSSSEVKQGERLTYVINACNYTEAIPVVNKQFVDGIVYSVPEGAVRLPLGCHLSTVSVKIPKNLPPSEYKLKIFVDYEVNPVRHIIREYETEKFSVIK